MRRPSCSVVVPVYNGSRSLPELVRRLQPVLRQIASRYELILVDDGSADESWEVIRKLARQHAWVRGIRLMRNFGQHNAVLCGVRAARHEITVTMDDDLQHPPEEVRRLVAELQRGYDLVFGVPQQEQHGFFRDLASQVTKLSLRYATGLREVQWVSPFRAFRTDLRQAFETFSGPLVSMDVLLVWGARRISSLRVRHDPRRLGVSNYNFAKLMTHALNLITGFSTAPLRLASLLGFLATLFGLGVLIYVVGRYLIQGAVVQGFAFLASTIAIFSGVQLLALGILGEYFARMYLHVIHRPTYSVREQTPARRSEANR